MKGSSLLVNTLLSRFGSIPYYFCLGVLRFARFSSGSWNSRAVPESRWLSIPVSVTACRARAVRPAPRSPRARRVPRPCPRRARARVWARLCSAAPSRTLPENPKHWKFKLYLVSATSVQGARFSFVRPTRLSKMGRVCVSRSDSTQIDTGYLFDVRRYLDGICMYL